MQRGVRPADAASSAGERAILVARAALATLTQLLHPQTFITVCESRGYMYPAKVWNEHALTWQYVCVTR
jgi:hypothetical protein